MRKIIITVFGVAGLAIAGYWCNGELPTKASEKVTREQEKSTEIEMLVTQLGSATPATREAASKALVKIGNDALPYLKGALKSADVEQRRRAENLHVQIYESWIQIRAERAAKYGIDVVVERMVHKGKDLTEDEWDVFANIVEKIRTETKWRQTLPRKKYLQMPLKFDPKDNEPQLGYSRLLAKRIIRDDALFANLCICSGEAKVLEGFQNTIIFANGDIDCGNMISTSLVVCDGNVSIAWANKAVVIARGSVKLTGAILSPHTTIFDEYRDGTPGLRFFSVRDLGVHLSGGTKKDAFRVVVATLQNGSLLEKAGIKANDTIFTINGKDLTHPDQARRLFRSAMADGHIEIELRDEKRVVRVEIPW